MAVGYNPRAITDGLVLALDAGNPKNYNAGISTNWTDKVGGNNGTLVGGTYHNDGPFVGAGYVEFDGTDDELNFTSIDVGTGDFTYEAWVYPTASVNQPIIVWHNSTSKVHTFGLWASGQGVDAIFSANARPGSSNSFEVTSAISLNTWHHIAFVRASGTLKVYVDGTEKSLSEGSGSIGGDPSSYSTDVSYVGSSAVNENFVGKISNARVISGTALYTSNFTPPTKPLTAVTNTKLLTCQGNTISPGTDIVVTTSNKGSGSVGSLSAVTSSGNYYFDNRSASPSTASIQLDFKTVQTGVTQIKLSGGGYQQGSTYDLYVNGVLVENDRSTKTLWAEDTITISSTNISSIKIEGSDGYSLGALKFNGTLVSGTISEIVPNGDISLTKEPFAGAGAVKFDGTGDYLSFTKNTTTGSFTCECWFYRGADVSNYHIIFSGDNLGSVNANNVQLQVSNTGAVGWYQGASVISQTGTAVQQNAWNHIAWVRSGTSCAIFVNGSRIATGTNSNALNVTQISTYLSGGYQLNGYISNARIVDAAVYDPAQTTISVPTKPLEPIENTFLLTCQGQNIKDASSNAYAITVNGDAKATIVSSAFELDGTDDCVDVTNNANLYPGTGDFTAEVWCRGESATSDYHYLLSNYGNSGSNYYGWAILTQSNGSGIRAYMQSGSGATGVTISNTTVNLNDSNWHHVVFVRSGNAIRLYHNGEQLESDGDVTGYNVTSSEAKFRIGKVRDAADPNGGYYFWNGKISGVKIYKGKGLTAAEVTQNYNATKGRYA